MKIPVWTLALHNDGTVEDFAFASEAEQNAKFWEVLETEARLDADDIAQLRSEHGNDLQAVYDAACNDLMMDITMSWGCQDIEVPDPVLGEVAGFTQSVRSLEKFAGMLERLDQNEISGHLQNVLTFMKAQMGSAVIPDPAEAAPSLGYAVIYESDDGDNEAVEAFFDSYETPEAAEAAFRESYPPGERKHGYHQAFDARLVAILKPLEGYEYPPVPAETAEEEEEENENRFTNYYECDCGTTWEDNWSCTCNDRCPKCNREIEPYKSEENEEA